MTSPAPAGSGTQGRLGFPSWRQVVGPDARESRALQLLSTGSQHPPGPACSFRGLPAGHPTALSPSADPPPLSCCPATSPRGAQSPGVEWLLAMRLVRGSFPAGSRVLRGLMSPPLPPHGQREDRWGARARRSHLAPAVRLSTTVSGKSVTADSNVRPGSGSRDQSFDTSVAQFQLQEK